MRMRKLSIIIPMYNDQKSLTYLYQRLLLEDKIKISDCITLILGLSGTVLFRHNGVISFILTIISIIYLIYKFKDKLYFFSIIVSFDLLYSYNYMYNIIDEKKKM